MSVIKYKKGLRLAVAVLALVFFNATNAQSMSVFGHENTEIEKKDIPVEVVADQLEYTKDKSKIIGKGNVIVHYDDMKITCDAAEVYTVTKEAHVNGHVILARKSDTLKGDTGYYNFLSDEGDFPQGTFVDEPFYGSGENINVINKDKISIENGLITTCNHYDDPGLRVHYDIQAAHITIYPNDKIVARNVKIHMLDKTIFWVPWIIIPLDNRDSWFHVQPGYSSEDGAYVLTSKRYSINKNISGKGHIDWRSKRGWGFGNDLDYQYKTIGSGLVKAYITDDEESPDQKAADPYDTRIDDTRYRFTWKHKKNIGRTSIQAEVNKLSDRYLLKDFFEREYRSEADPETFVTVTHNEDNFGLLLNFEKRINHFVNTIERLPEVRFNWNNQEILDTNVYYKNETSGISFNKKRANSSNDDDVFRLDTFNELSYPFKISQVALKPFANWRGDYYSKNKFGEENLTRQVIGGGLDMNTKFYKVFDIETNALSLNINQLRHIFEPNFNYTFVRHRSVLPSELFQMDDADAIDDIDTIQFGFDNRLQTKREMRDGLKTVNIVSYNTYLNYEFNAEVNRVSGGQENGSSFIDWHNEFEFRPYSWLITKFDIIYDFPNNQFESADLDIELYQSKKWHFYLQNQFTKEGSKLLTVDAMYRLNDKWGLGGYMRYEFDEGNVAEEWEIRASRDLHCWLLDFGYNVRNSDIDSSNKEVFFELTLKAFPDFPLKAGNHATYSRSRIGNTVSGSNESHQEDVDSYEYIRY